VDWRKPSNSSITFETSSVFSSVSNMGGSGGSVTDENPLCGYDPKFPAARPSRLLDMPGVPFLQDDSNFSYRADFGGLYVP
jgi:hypothetical protein